MVHTDSTLQIVPIHTRYTLIFSTLLTPFRTSYTVILFKIIPLHRTGIHTAVFKDLQLMLAFSTLLFIAIYTVILTWYTDTIFPVKTYRTLRFTLSIMQHSAKKTGQTPLVIALSTVIRTIYTHSIFR